MLPENLLAPLYSPTGQLYDATDELLFASALEYLSEHPQAHIAVDSERFGALALSLAHTLGETRIGPGHRIRVYQDLLSSRRIVERNAAVLGISVQPATERSSAFEAADVVLSQFPKSVAGVSEIAHATAQYGRPDVQVIGGGRIKYLSLAMNKALARSFSQVQPQLAHKKSRLIKARGALLSQPLVSQPLPPARQLVRLATGQQIHLRGYGETFGAARLDAGSDFLVESLADLSAVSTIYDLGCGNGTIAAAVAQRYPTATIIASDDSASAVRSSIATMRANQLETVTVVHSDGLEHVPGHSAEVIILNPPFHRGGSLDTTVAQRLFSEAAGALREGGRLFTVWNSPLNYAPALKKLVGPTQQIARNATFTVTVSTQS